MSATSTQRQLQNNPPPTPSRKANAPFSVETSLRASKSGLEQGPPGLCSLFIFVLFPETPLLGRPFGAQPRKAAANPPPTPSSRGQNGQSGRPEPCVAPALTHRSTPNPLAIQTHRSTPNPLVASPPLRGKEPMRPPSPLALQTRQSPLLRRGLVAGSPEATRAATAGGARRGSGRAVQGLAAIAAGEGVAGYYTQHQVMDHPLCCARGSGLAMTSCCVWSPTVAAGVRSDFSGRLVGMCGGGRAGPQPGNLGE